MQKVINVEIERSVHAEISALKSLTGKSNKTLYYLALSLGKYEKKIMDGDTMTVQVFADNNLYRTCKMEAIGNDVTTPFYCRCRLINGIKILKQKQRENAKL